jgi:hypothetical protein
MKGIFFTEFLEMAEREYGSPTVEKLISSLDAGYHGVFNADTDYSFNHFYELILLLSQQVMLSPSDIAKNFGEYLFSRMVILYRPQFAGNSDIFRFLEQIDYFIHVKLHEKFPHNGIRDFKTERLNETTFKVSFQSRRELIDLAIGLFMGCQKFFNEDLVLYTETRAEQDKDMVCFTLSKTRVLV